MAETSFETSIKALPVITGCFTSGAMMSLSLVAVPVMLDTFKEPPQLYQQWAQMYYYGRQIFPAMAITTLALYAYIGVKRRFARRPWTIFAIAGAVTVLMVPFTWIFMAPTNTILFGLEAKTKLSAVTDLTEAHALLRKWSLLHMIRSIFPLSGAMIGFSAILEG